MKGRKPAQTPMAEVVDLPTSAVRIPTCPEYMEGRSRIVWELVTRELVARNIYDTDVREMVAAYCIQYARFLDAENDVHKRGTVIRSTKRNSQLYNPLLSVSDRAYDRMVKLAAELGLTPVSRKRVTKVRGSAGAAANKYLRQG